MLRQIEFWYEFASTYSYPAAMRVEEVAKEHQVTVLWKPFLLGPIFKALGWDTSPFNLQPAKGAYMWRDLERICAKQGVHFRKPTIFPQNGLLAARIAISLRDQQLQGQFTRAVFQWNFSEAQNISDEQCLAEILTDLGCDATLVLEQAASPTNKAALKDQTDQARAHGIFGAPTWRTPDGELFWGNDRLEDALDWSETR